MPVETLGPPRRARAGAFRLGLLLLGMGLLTVALARPLRVDLTSHREASGIDILLALDVSRSMLADDISIGQERANRLEAVKKVTEDFIDARPNDRIGMLAFAGRPYLVSPLTLDHDWLRRNLDRLQVGLVQDGTAIGLAIASAANRLKERHESKSRIIVLLTDGGNNSGNVTPLNAAEAAAALGLKIYTIGVGSEHEARIPVPGRFGRTEYQMIPVDVDVESLKKIATLSHGEFYRATDGDSLQRIFGTIDQLEKTTVRMSEVRNSEDLYPWLAVPGAFLVSLYALFGQAWTRRLP